MGADAVHCLSVRCTYIICEFQVIAAARVLRMYHSSWTTQIYTEAKLLTGILSFCGVQCQVMIIYCCPSTRHRLGGFCVAPGFLGLHCIEILRAYFLL